MKLANSMELRVKNHLRLLRAESPNRDETCWCPLCRADMMALALTSLPPRYATRRHGEPGLDPRSAETVHAEVARAVRHVERFPKHPSGQAVAAGEPVWVVNFPLEESFKAVDTMIRSHEGICDCWNCRCDMVAFALNRYPAHYGVEHGGRTLLLDEARERMRGELAAYLDLAIRVVLTVPRHDSPSATI